MELQENTTASKSDTLHYISTIFGICLYSVFGVVIAWGSDQNYTYLYTYLIVWLSIFPAAVICFTNKNLRKKVKGLTFLLIAYTAALLNMYLMGILNGFSPAYVFGYIVLAVASSESFSITTKNFALGMFTLIVLLTSSFIFIDIVFPKLAFILGLNMLLLWRLYNGLIQLKVNETLIQEKDKIDTIFNTVEDGIMVVDNKTDIIKEANATAAMIYGLSSNSLIGKRFKVFRSSAPDGYIAMDHHSHSWQQRSDASIFPAEIRFSSIASTAETIVTVRDISKRLEIEQETFKSQQAFEVQARLVSLGEMAGGIAHEINNPLAVVKGGMFMIKKTLADKKPNYEESIVQSLEKINSMIDRIVSIISGLKRISRDAKQDPLIMTDISLIISNALEVSKGRFENSGIELTVNSFPQNLKLNCREIEISQVLVNLLNNSFDAIESSQTSNKHFCKIEVSTTNSKIEIRVIDSGDGVDSEFKDKIYQPFFTTKDIGKGTGLGLSISKSIIESHNGKLYFLDKSPTTCVLEFPLEA